MAKGDKSSIARAYRKKYGAEMATRKLARIMYQENNLLFNNYEDARKFIGYIEGKRSNRKIDVIVNSEFYRPETRPINPYQLPESDEISYDPYVISGNKRIGRVTAYFVGSLVRQRP